MHLASPIDLARLLRQQWLSPEDLAELQRRKLVAMVRHAYEEVPYYRELFDSVGATPGDIRAAGDLRHIPTTTHLTIESLPRDAINARGTNLRACKQITTAGSSGTPLSVVLRDSDSSFYDMGWARTALADGRRLRDRVAGMKFRMPPSHCFERLGIWRKSNISIVQPIERRFEELLRCRPDVLRAKPYQLVELARAALREGIDGFRPRLVFSAGSVLDEGARELVTRAFGGEVFDFYGATELGDVAVPNDRRCPCGRGLPMMRGIVGRADDFFVARDGSIRSPSIIVNRLKLIPGISRFHLTQKRDRRILARIVSGDGFGDETRAQLVSTLQEIMADGSEVDVEIVPEIRADPAKKVRCLISELPTPL